MKKLALTLLSISISAVTHAGELGQPGFDGEVTGLVGFSSGKSNFNTDTESKTGDLNTEAESESEALVAPLGQAVIPLVKAITIKCSSVPQEKISPWVILCLKAVIS